MTVQVPETQARRCPVDGAATDLLDREQLYRCTRCGHAWVGEPHVAQDIYESGYFADHAAIPPAYQRWLRSRYSEILRVSRRFAEPKTALDVGCGQGDFVRFLLDVGVDAEGVEPSIHYSEFCRSQGLKVRTGYAEHFLSERRCFDLVSAIQVLEHVENPLAPLRSMRRLVAPAGVVYVEVPDHLRAWRRLVKRALGRPRVTTEELARCGDWHSFTKYSLSLLLAAAGFRVLRVDSRDYIEPMAPAERRVAVWTANVFVRLGMLAGNIIRAWARPG